MMKGDDLSLHKGKRKEDVGGSIASNKISMTKINEGFKKPKQVCDQQKIIMKLQNCLALVSVYSHGQQIGS